MKIYEALAEVKTLKARLVQLSNFRQSTLIHDADSKPDFDFHELSKRMDKTLERVTQLKLAIQTANMTNKVRVGDADMSLANAILELANVRTSLAYVTGMLSEDKPDLFGRRYRARDEVQQKRQVSPADLLQLQADYEGRKNLLDSVIQEANHRVSIAV